MARGGDVLAQRHADRREGDDTARDRTADELRHDAGGADALTGIRIALPPRVDPATLGADPALRVVGLGGTTMGTGWTVRVAVPRRFDPAPLRSVIVARLDRIVAEMSHWVPDSALSRFNRAPADSWTTLPPDLAHVVASGFAIAGMTGGAFDPAIGALVDRWGHGPPGPMPSPDDAAIEAARARSGWQRLAYDPAARRLRQPGGVQLDLSGIAKGHAVDAVAAVVAGAGIAHALVEIGGELAGRGVRPDGQPWWVDLESPPGVALPPLRIALHGLGVATSGNYRRGDHTIDPRTGRPASGGIASVSVLHPSAMIADAWATALTVMGADEAIAAATRHALAARIVTRDAEHLSPALAAMLAD